MVWEHDSPAILNSNLRMTEYNLVSIWTNATVSEYALKKSTQKDENIKKEGYSPSVIEHVHYYGKFGKITNSLFLLIHILKVVCLLGMFESLQ